MTVRELIDKLNQFDPELEVWEFNEDDSDWTPFEEPFEPQEVTMYRSGSTWFSKARWSRYLASAEDRRKADQELIEKALEEKLVIGL